MKRQSHKSRLAASRRLRDKLAETGGHLADVGHLAKETVQEKLVNIKTAATEGVRARKDRLIDIENGFEERVRKRPIKYLLMATGIGAVLGLFFRRSY